MSRIAERALRVVSRGVVWAGLPSPAVLGLAEARRVAAEEVLARRGPVALELAEAMDAGKADAALAYGAHVERAVGEMRAQVAERTRGILGRSVARAHALLSDPEGQEWLDDPGFDRARRLRLIGNLDAINTAVGNYEAFLRQMESRFEGPMRILDLAAGHGGFALEVARMARARGLSIEITASDLLPEYLALGEAIAERERLAITFMQQDALDLSNIESGAFDLIVSTQSIHHFPIGMTARMFREAARIAGRGVVFIDACRSFTFAAVIPTLALLCYADAALAHDGFVSIRRSYCPEELGLVARLGPERDGVEVDWMAPAHCVLRWSPARDRLR